MDENLDEIFGYIAQADYDGVEGGLAWTSNKEKAERLHKLLNEHSLRLPSLYQGGAYHDRNEAEKTVENTIERAKFAAEIGCPGVNVNPTPIGREKTDEELKVQGAPGSGFAWETFNRLQSRLTAPSLTNYAAVIFLIGGALFTFLLMAMRMRFLWWPLHPAGYALSMNFGIDYIWFCLVLSSAAKAIILKYGGISTHRKAVPFFLGLILGEFTVGTSWSMLSVVLQPKVHGRCDTRVQGCFSSLAPWSPCVLF